jgi:hypothetical protein
MVACKTQEAACLKEEEAIEEAKVRATQGCIIRWAVPIPKVLLKQVYLLVNSILNNLETWVK